MSISETRASFNDVFEKKWQMMHDLVATQDLGGTRFIVLAQKAKTLVQAQDEFDSSLLLNSDLEFVQAGCMVNYHLVHAFERSDAKFDAPMWAALKGWLEQRKGFSLQSVLAIVAIFWSNFCETTPGLNQDGFAFLVTLELQAKAFMAEMSAAEDTAAKQAVVDRWAAPRA